VGNQHCVRVREGGEVLAAVDLDRCAFACALSQGQDPRLFVVGQDFGGPGPAQPSGAGFTINGSANPLVRLANDILTWLAG
jgi:hypothetical protein